MSLLEVLENGTDGYGAELHCPRCRCENLHQYKVEVFHRRKEDADDGIHVQVQHLNVEIDTAVEKGNPSRRRQGIKILFWCEQCDARPILNIVQHKGTTLVEMVDDGTRLSDADKQDLNKGEIGG